MKKVFVQGSYDLFHYGHLVSLKKAKEVADKIGGILVVGVNTDELYKDYKEKEPVIPYKYRKEVIDSLKCVDKVVPAPEFSPMNILKEYDIDVYIICEEWRETKKKEIEYMISKGGMVTVLPYFPTISSTEIRDKLVKNYLDHSKILCSECHKKL